MIIINYQLNCKYNIRIVVFFKMKVVIHLLKMTTRVLYELW